MQTHHPVVRFILFVAFLLSFALSASRPLYAQGRPDLVWMRGGNSGDYGLAYSLDNRYLVSSSGGTVQIRRVADSILIRTLQVNTQALCVAISPDNTLVAAGCADRGVRVWRVSDGTLLHSLFTASSRINCVAFSPDGSLIAGASDDWTIRLWRTGNGTQFRTLPDHTAAARWLTFSRDGQKFVSCSNSETIVRDTSDWQENYRVYGGGHVAFSPDGEIFATTPDGAQSNLWRTSDGVHQGVIGTNSRGRIPITFTPDGNFMVRNDGNIGIWRMSDRTMVREIPANVSIITLACSPDNQTFTAGDNISFMQEWRLSDGTPTRTFTEPNSFLSALAASPDGKYVASCGGSSSNPEIIHVRRVSDGAIVRTLTIPNFIRSVAFSPDSQFLAAGADDTRVHIWRTSDWSEFSLPHYPGEGVMYVTFSPDGRFLAAGNLGGALRLWAVPSFTECASERVSNMVSAIAFSPDSSRVAWSGNDQIYLWNTSNCQLVRTINTGTPRIQGLSFTADGQEILSYTGNGQTLVRFWHVSDGTLSRSIDTGQPIGTVVVSPDGQVLATCHSASLQYWLLQNGSRLQTYDTEVVHYVNNEANRISGLAYSADGKYVYHGRFDAVVWSSLNPFRNTVLPKVGGNTGNVTVKIITPTTFSVPDGATITLRDGVNPDITMTATSLNDHLLTGTFALNGAPLGKRDVVITRPDEETQTYPQGFTIEQGRADDLWLSIVGKPQVRRGRLEPYIVTFGNNGNVDAYDSVLNLILPGHATYRVRPERPTPTDLGYTWLPSVDFSSVPHAINDGNSKVLQFWIPKLEAGRAASYPISIATFSPTGGTIEAIRAEFSPVNDSTFSMAGNPLQFSSSPVFGALVEAALQAEHNENNEDERRAKQDRLENVSRDLLRWKELYNRLPDDPRPPTSPFDIYMGVLTAGLDVGLDLLKRALPDVLKGRKGVDDANHVEELGAIDPNEIVGPVGFGQSSWIPATLPLNYRVLFENLPTATAAAAEVVVTDRLDAVNLDLTTFTLGEIKFGRWSVTPTQDVALPIGQRKFSAIVDQRPDINLLVRVEAELDMLTGELITRFTSLDPDTMMPPDDLRGFLPRNVNPPDGEGSIQFSVLPKADATNGGIITNQASIVFDFNAPIVTNIWANTLDSLKPSTQMQALSVIQLNPGFTVRWEGNDGIVGSGLKDYSVYVSDNGGPFTSWQTNTTETQATFNGEIGHAYAFYAIARDNAGNIEDIPAQPDTTTTVAGISLSGTLTLENCASAAQPITFTLRPTAGGQVFSRTVTPSANGTYTLANIPGGRYTLHIKGEKWLAKNITIDCTTGDISGVNADLLGGDANNDNSVDVFDLDLLVQAFNSVLGEGAWNAGADFNCDDSVDVFDLDLLIRNFNQAGDD